MNIKDCYNELVRCGYTYDKMKEMLDGSVEIEVEVDGEKRVFAVKSYDESYEYLYETETVSNELLNLTLLTCVYDGGLVYILNNTDIVNHGNCTDEDLVILDAICLCEFFDSLGKGALKFAMHFDIDLINKDIDIDRLKEFFNIEA